MIDQKLFTPRPDHTQKQHEELRSDSGGDFQGFWNTNGCGGRWLREAAGSPRGARSFPEHCIRTDGQTVKAVSDPCRSGTRMTAGPPPPAPSRPCCVSLLCPQAALPAAPACSFSVETNCQEHTATQLLHGQAGGFSLILRHPPHPVLQAPGFKPCQGRAVGRVQKPG